MNTSTSITPEVEIEIKRLLAQYPLRNSMVIGDLFDEAIAHQAIDNVAERNRIRDNEQRAALHNSPRGFFHHLGVALKNIIALFVLVAVAIPLIYLVVYRFSSPISTVAAGQATMPWYAFCPCAFVLILAVLLLAIMRTKLD